MSHNYEHSHGTKNVSDRVLLWAVIVNLGLSAFEFVAGAISGSVALMADALHNTNDAAALLIAYVARLMLKIRLLGNQILVSIIADKDHPNHFVIVLYLTYINLKSFKFQPK